MQSFSQYTAESERRRKLSRQSPAAQSSPAEGDGSTSTTTSQPQPEPDSGLILGIIEQMKRVRLIAEDTDQADLTGIAKALGDRIIAVHSALMNDPGGGVQVRRLSYQNMVLAFLTMLSLGANRTEEPR